MLHYEDIVVGTKSSYGKYEVTREEVIEFATKYDPQPFHLSDEGTRCASSMKSSPNAAQNRAPKWVALSVAPQCLIRTMLR